MRSNNMPDDEFQKMLDAALSGNQVQLDKFTNSMHLLNNAQRITVHRAVTQQSAQSADDPNSLFLQGVLFSHALGIPENIEKAMDFYSRSAQLKNGNAFTFIGISIERGHYHPTPQFFNTTGVVNPGGNQYQQAAAFLRQGMQLNNADSFNTLAYLVGQGHYNPIPKDFEAAKIQSPGSDQYKQAAAFYRAAIVLDSSFAHSNLGAMIKDRLYSPVAEDFEAIKAKNPGGNRYQQALPFLLRCYSLAATSKNKTVEIVAYLNRVIRNQSDPSGDHHLALCRLYFLDKNDQSYSRYYLDNHPNQKKAIASLLHEVIEHLDSQDGDIEKAQTLLDFCIDNGAAVHMPLMINHIQLKVLLYQNNDLKALAYYQKHIPNYYPLNALEYYRLGSVIYTQYLPDQDDKARKNTLYETLKLFYQGYYAARKSNHQGLKTQIETLMIKIRIDNTNKEKSFKGSVCFDSKSKDSKTLYNAFFEVEAFLEMHEKKLSRQKRNAKKLMACLAGFRFVREVALQPTFDFSFLGMHQNTAPELVFIDQMIKDLRTEKALKEMMKDDGFTRKLKQYPLLTKLITEKSGFKLTRKTAHLIGFLHARKDALQPTFNVWSTPQSPTPELLFIRQIIKDLNSGKLLTEKASDANFTQQLTKFPLLKKLIFEKMLLSQQTISTQQDNVVTPGTK